MPDIYLYYLNTIQCKINFLNFFFKPEKQISFKKKICIRVSTRANVAHNTFYQTYPFFMCNFFLYFLNCFFNIIFMN